MYNFKDVYAQYGSMWKGMQLPRNFLRYGGTIDFYVRFFKEDSSLFSWSDEIYGNWRYVWSCLSGGYLRVGFSVNANAPAIQSRTKLQINKWYRVTVVNYPLLRGEIYIDKNFEVSGPIKWEYGVSGLNAIWLMSGINNGNTLSGLRTYSSYFEFTCLTYWYDCFTKEEILRLPRWPYLDPRFADTVKYHFNARDPIYSVSSAKDTNFGKPHKVIDLDLSPDMLFILKSSEGVLI